MLRIERSEPIAVLRVTWHSNVAGLLVHNNGWGITTDLTNASKIIQNKLLGNTDYFD